MYTKEDAIQFLKEVADAEMNCFIKFGDDSREFMKRAELANLTEDFGLSEKMFRMSRASSEMSQRSLRNANRASNPSDEYINAAIEYLNKVRGTR